MQRPFYPSPPGPIAAPTEGAAPHDAGAGGRSAREVPDAQLWRDAIGAARRAAASAAELRQAIEAARPNGRP